MLSSVLGNRSPAPGSTATPAGASPPAGDLGVGAKPLAAAAAAPAPSEKVTYLSAGPSPVPTGESGKRLIVGPGISLSGEITACDRLVVQGSVQVTLNETRAIEIAEGGRFTNGKAEVEEAEISGVYEGDLVVRHRLLIRSTGRVQGNVRYGEIEVERGGKVTGSVSMLDAGPGAGMVSEIMASQPGGLKKNAA